MSDSNNLFSKNFYQNSNLNNPGLGCTTHDNESIPASLTISAQVEIQESIKKQLDNYYTKKSERNATPPYVTYNDDELIYLPTIIWKGDQMSGHTDWSDADFSQLVDWVNEMLAGTYTYIPPENATVDQGNPTSGVSYLAAQNDVNHGVDSGIRLRLMPTVPKHMFNPLGQMAKVFTDDTTETARSYMVVPSQTSSAVLNLRTEEPLPGDWSDHTLNGLTHYDTFVKRHYMAYDRGSVANLTENRVGSFTCGEYGSIITIPRKEGVYTSTIQALNRFDCNYTFNNNEPYDVYTGGLSGPFFHTQAFSNASWVNNTQFTYGSNLARMIPAMHFFLSGDKSSSQASFPISSTVSNQLLTETRNGWHQLTNPDKADSVSQQQDRRDVAAIMFHELGHTLGCYHAFHYGHGSYLNYSNSVNFRAQFDSNPKSKFLPFTNTKKSWYKNADSNIPPFEYTETDYNEEGEPVSVVKSYKNLSSDEQGYLEMMFHTLPKHLTNNYERKINFNTGSDTQDFYFEHGYPDYFSSELVESFLSTQDTPESTMKSQLSWKTVLNNYLAMFLGIDSLWGDSYILLDDNGDNVNIESGGKPEFVVNPTTDLVDGILTTTRGFVWPITVSQAGNSIYTVENTTALDDLTEEDFNDIDKINSCLVPELGGWILKKYGSRAHIIPEMTGLYSETTVFGAAQIKQGLNWTPTIEGYSDFELLTSLEWNALRAIGFTDKNCYMLNLSNFPIKNHTYYWTKDNCRTTGTTGAYDQTYDSSGVEVFFLSEKQTPGTGAAYFKWCQPHQHGHYFSHDFSNVATVRDYNPDAAVTIHLQFVRQHILPYEADIVNEEPPVEAGVEVIPANRKGPQITSRVPFCVPILNESTSIYEPSDVFDPAWFANMNWRDPKNRAYPENWPVSKLYDEFDANGDPLCPCLYAEQTVWIDGVERTYTPINASRTGFIPEILSGSITSWSDPAAKTAWQWMQNEQNINSILNEDAQILYKIQSHSFLKEHPTKTIAKASSTLPPDDVGYQLNNGAAGFMIESWNNSSMYVDTDNNIQIDINDTYPLNIFNRGKKGSAMKLYPSVGCDWNGHQITNSNISALSYPHSKGHFFQNYPIGYKPFPGGYSTDTYTSTDPIHYMMAPFGSAYFGMNPHGTSYLKFKPNWQNFIQEHLSEEDGAFTSGGLESLPGDYSTIMGSSVFESGLTFWNGEDDLHTLYYTDSGGNNVSTQLEYFKFTFGSTDPTSPYYNPYRLNLFKSSNLTKLHEQGTSDPILYDFSVFYGNSITDENGEVQNLIGTSTPSLGDINVGVLNNTMRYSNNAGVHDVAFLESSDDSCFILVNTNEYAKNGITPAAADSVPGSISGLFVGRTVMTPGQIFKARAYIENNVGNLKAIRDFGIENNVSASYTSENSLADHIEYVLNKVSNAEDYIEAGAFNFSFYDSYFDVENENSCSDGHCEESTPVYVCADPAGCNTVITQVNAEFLPTEETYGPKVRCPQNLDHGCYFIQNNDICNYTIQSKDSGLYCDSLGEIALFEICSEEGNNVLTTLHLNYVPSSSGVGIGFYNEDGEVVLESLALYEYGGQLYSNYSGTTTKIYYYNPTQITEDEKQKASKKFEKLHKNLTKIVSFAK